VRALLADLVERGLATDRSLLIVIDGTKALLKAVVEVFGANALIQRCREHKKRCLCEAQLASFEVLERPGIKELGCTVQRQAVWCIRRD